MIANVITGLRNRPWAALGLIAFTCVASQMVLSQTALAADCPGHPDAIGTSRTIVVDPREHPLIGTMQYAKTLPLEDHEVVLTFDDGPLPKYSNQILDILAAHCAKATFFLVGNQARANPEGVRKVRDAGHTVATHSQSHPSNMHRLPVDRALREIDDGIASVTAALGDGAALAPFFRIPGLARNDAMEAYTESRGLQIWSADFPADDWRPVSSQRVYDLAIQRLEAKGKGILLLHDIQPRTVAALPRILNEMKARGYRIVHVVAATAERPATPTEPQQWQLNPVSETVAISRWPKIPNFVFAETGALPAPALSDIDGRHLELSARTTRPARGAAMWPQQMALAPDNAAIELPIPAVSVFRMQESMRVTLLGKLSDAHRAEQTAQAAREAKAAAKRIPESGKSRRQARTASVRPARGERASAHPAPRQARPAAHAGRGAPKQALQGKKNARAVRIAGLKKR